MRVNDGAVTRRSAISTEGGGDVTKAELEQLRSLKSEIRHLNEELLNLPTVTDSVKGSMVEFPYIEQTVVIKGIDETAAVRLRRKVERKCEELQEQMLFMEEWLDGVQDSETRDILRMKYRNGLSDNQIGMELGYTRSAIAMKIQRFFSRAQV